MAPKKKKQEINAETVNKYLTDNPDYAREWFAKNGGSIGVAIPGPSLPISVSHSAPGPRPVNSPSPTLISDDEKEEKEALTANLFKDYIDGTRSRKVSCRQLDVARLKELNEQELFMELIKDIANELDVNVLCHKILMNVSVLTNSDRGSLFLARGPAGHRTLYSKLFDVTAVSTLEESLKAAERGFTVPFGKGIAGHVALSKEVVNIKQAYDDPRFNQDVDKATGYRTHSILCMPILNYEEEVIGVAQIINKSSGDHEFTKQDEQVFQKYLTFCGIGIMNAQLFQMSVDEYKRNKLLLRLARGIFKEQSSMDQLIRKILQEAHGLLKCERVVVHLIDTKISFRTSETNIDNAVEDSGSDKTKDSKELRNMNKMMMKARKTISFSQVYDMMAKDGSVETPNVDLAEKWRVTQIAREIAVGQKVVNIADFEADGRFGKDGVVDDKGFVVKSLLCMPIFDSEQQVIGVAQMMNRLDGQVFAASDVNIFEAFAIFCGLGIHNTTTYENVCKLMAKQRVALEVLSYHATAPKEEVDKLVAAEIPSADVFNLYSFTFNDIPQTDIETVYSVIRMFLDCNIPTIFHVPYDVLCRWTLSVKKNYRPVTYHNWRHAFNVAQTMFTMIFTGGMSKYLGDQEIFGLLVACLCHDLDHRGTNNAFQEKSDSPLALLYSTSTMEHHHFDQCIMILNSEGNNIFEYMSPAIYKNVIRILENAIISTDLALYFKKRGDFQALVDAGETQWKESRKKDLLRGMMMTACDVAAITKPWEIQKEVAHLVAGEFFEQGDIEKSRLNLKPIAMMDREKKDELPKMQVGFIDAICTPIYKTLAFVEPGLKPLYDGCLNNRRNWQNLADEQDGKLSTDGPATSSSDPPTKKAKMSSTEKDGPSREEKNNQINKECGQKNGKMDPLAKIKSEEAPKKTKSKTCGIL